MHLVRRLSPFLLVIIACTPLLAQTAHVAFDGINLRQKPTADSAIVATLKKGAELQVLEKVGTWYRVRMKPSGPEGYINSIVVDIQAQGTTASGKTISDPAPRPESAPATKAKGASDRVAPPPASGASRAASSAPKPASVPTTTAKDAPDLVAPPPVADAPRSASSSAGSQSSQHGGSFTIFVSAPERDGFLDTSKAIEDSIKDVKNLLTKLKKVDLIVTDTRSAADIVLTVVQRGVGVQAYGQRVSAERYYGGTVLESTPMVASTFWLSTVLEVGKFKKEFTGQQVNGGASPFSYGAWTAIAMQVSSNVGSWVSANAEQLRRNKQ